MRLENQHIFITGSTTGIGEHMARRFVAEGAKVILHGRDNERAQKLRSDIVRHQRHLSKEILVTLKN